MYRYDSIYLIGQYSLFVKKMPDTQAEKDTIMKKILTSTNYELIPLNDQTNVRFYTSEDSGSYVAPHWHDAVEIVYLLDGRLNVITENTVHKLSAGQCIMLSPNQVHSTLCTAPNRAIVFQIPESFLEKFIPDARSRIFSFKEPAESSVQQSKIELFKDTLSKMQLLIDCKPDGAILRFNSLLFEVLFQIYHNFSLSAPPADTAKRSRDLGKLDPVLNYIMKNYNRPVPLSEIAGIAMLEPKYFCRFFKKYMGMTFLEYQNEIRISKIYEDVISTSDKIGDILERHGFTNYKLFRKMFQEHFNATPTQCRLRRQTNLS